MYRLIGLRGADNSFHGGNNDAFVAKVTTGGFLAWATYLGGTDRDCGYGIAVDGAGNALVTGYSYSSDFAGANNLYHGGGDAFVAKVSYATASAAPTGVDLLPASDTGVSSTDDLTNLDNSASGKTLQFAVSGTISGATVTIYADATASGSATASGTTTTVTTDGAHDLPDGARSITARQTEPGKTESPDSPALAITVDTVAPAAPAVPVLDPSTDSGVVGDNITKFTTPTFDLSGLTSPPDYFRFYRGTAKISGDYETGTTYTTAAQTDGTYLYQLSAVDAAGNESPWAPA